MDAGKKRAKLKQLATTIRKGIFEMIKIADELLSDFAYVDQFGGEAALIEDMENKEFAHFGGSPSLGQLLRAYRESPDEKTWKEYDYNVWAMIELSRPVKEKAPVERINWKQLCKELQAQVEVLESERDRAREQAEAMEERVAELVEATSKLQGRLSVYEERGRYVGV